MKEEEKGEDKKGGAKIRSGRAVTNEKRKSQNQKTGKIKLGTG